MYKDFIYLIYIIYLVILFLTRGNAEKGKYIILKIINVLVNLKTVKLTLYKLSKLLILVKHIHGHILLLIDLKTKNLINHLLVFFENTEFHASVFISCGVQFCCSIWYNIFLLIVMCMVAINDLYCNTLYRS